MENKAQAQNNADALEKAIRKQKYELFIGTLALVIEKYREYILEGSGSAA